MKYLDICTEIGTNILQPRRAMMNVEFITEMHRRGMKGNVFYANSPDDIRAYTALGIGEMVGMPVPGTCTSVWWEQLQDRSMTFGIPEVGYIDNDGDLLENKQISPEHLVDNDPALEAVGRDQQLEKAVEVLLATLDAE